jgi:molybdate transport system substrate-binding protein
VGSSSILAVASTVLLFTAPASAADLIVSAAASLTNAFTDIGKEFEKANQPHKVIFNFASSGALLQQISRGAPVDVFASADQDTMDRADKQNLIVRGTRKDFTANALVLVAPKDSGASISALEDLQRDPVKRIAISNPDTVPVGKYSKAALEKAGVFAGLREKFIFTQNVRQSLDYVARAEVDVGFVYETDAAIMQQRVKVLFQVSTPVPITYPIAAVKGSGKERLAGAFVDFVRSRAAQAILQKHGFRAVN